MLCQDDRRTEFPVDLAEGGEEVRRGNGVKLARRFVEDQDFRLKHHHGRKVQELLLTARKCRDGLIKPRLDAEETCHFRNAAANGRRIIAKGFQPERQLMPDLIRDDLVFGALLHEANLFCLFALVKGIQISSLKQNLAASAPVRRKDGFELPQQRRFAAARGAAKHQKLARLDGQRQIGNCVFRLFRVSKIQAFDCKDFHCLSSFRSSITGVNTSAR